MRIGIITGEYPPMPGGVGAYTRILAETLAENDNDIFLLSREGTVSNEFPVETVTSWGLNSWQTIQQWAKKHQLHLINLQFQTAAYEMSPWIHFLPHRVKTPLVTTFHDLRFPYLFPKAGRLRDWIVMYLARQSAGVIVTNHEDLARVNMVPKHQLIPIGSNIRTSLPDNFDRQAWRKKAGACDDDILLAHFGFIKEVKGIHLLLDAMSQLIQKGHKIKLVMIGGRKNVVDTNEDTYLQSLDKQIENLGLNSHITWTGFVDEEAVTAYLSVSDMAVFPFLEGVSYQHGSLMAGIHHHCAIITTTPNTPIPTFQHGENLYLISPNDKNALQVAIEALIQQPEKRDTLRQGTHNLAKNFSWDAIADETLDFFQTVLEASQ